jgi:hypothetical protein
MSYHLVGLVMKARINDADGKPDPVAKFVLAAVAWNCRDDRGAAHPSLEILISQTGHSRSTIKRALHRLEDDYRLLSITDRAGGRGLAQTLQMDIPRLEALIPIKPQRELTLTNLRVEPGKKGFTETPFSKTKGVHSEQKGVHSDSERGSERPEKGFTVNPHQHVSACNQILSATTAEHPAVAPLLAAAGDRPAGAKDHEQPASVFGFSICLKFAQAKRKEFGLLAPGGFARAICWMTGSYDGEIADWLIGEHELQMRSPDVASGAIEEWGPQSEKEALYLLEKSNRLCLLPRERSAVA